MQTFCGHGAPRKAQVSWQRQGGSRQGTLSTRAKDNSWRIRSQWLENSAQTDVDVPIDIAWALWEDRTLIPKWMPWISSVEIQEEDSRLSKWTLSTYQFNRQWEFSWLALNMTPLKHQKIHWRSVPGSSSGSLGSIEIQNQGQIRFLKKGSEQCAVKLTISYEVPNALAPFANVRLLFIFLNRTRSLCAFVYGLLLTIETDTLRITRRILACFTAVAYPSCGRNTSE